MSALHQEQIRLLCDTVRKGLHLTNLDELTRLASSLTEDAADTVLFYTLKHIFNDLATALDNQAVSVERFHDLTAGTGSDLEPILAALQNRVTVRPEVLESLVRGHVVRLAMFKEH